MVRSSTLTWALVWSVGLGLLVSFLTVWSVGFGHLVDTFRHADLRILSLYAAVSVLIALLLTLKWHVALDAYGVRLPFPTLVIYRLIGFAVSYVTPTAHVGGEPIRAMLVERDGIPPKVSFSAVIADKSLEMLFDITLFFIGALILLNTADFALAARITIFVLSVLLVLLGVVFIRRVLRHESVFVPFLRLFRFHKRAGWRRLEKQVRETEGLVEHFYRRRPKHFFASIAIMAALWALMFVEYKLALALLGLDASIAHIFLLLTGVGIAYALPIPAALGVLELGQVSTSAILKLGGAVGAGLALIIRARDIVWVLIGLLLLGLLQLNLFRLRDRSIEAALRYKFRSVDMELRDLYRSPKGGEGAAVKEGRR